MQRPAITWRDRVRYRFENTLSRGTIAIIGWLAVVSAIIVVVASLALVFFAVKSDPADVASGLSFSESMWQSLMRTLDAGNLAGDQGGLMRLIMFLVTIGGIFIVSSLIGTITSGLQSRLDELRKGRSRVIETGHTLILGWNSKIYSIVGELIIANENQRNPCIVILAERDKVQMEDELRVKFPDTRGLRVICRSGDPLDLDDLQVVDPHAAKSIIVLAPENDVPDIHVIKSVLAITNHPHRKPEPYHIVAEIRDDRSLEAAALVGGKEAIYVQGDDLIARVTAQTCRQSGLSVVYTELLDFAGSEFYLKIEPALVGRTYQFALSAYPEAVVVGLAHVDGTVEINPPMDRIFAADEQVIAISEDDDKLALRVDVPPMPELALISHGRRVAAVAERTLIIGWNQKAEAVIRELDQYVAVGSEVVVLCDREGIDKAINELRPGLKHQQLRFQEGETTSRAELDAIEVGRFDHVIVLCNPALPIQQADAQTLITLLHLRAIVEKQAFKLSIVSEMMDLRNRALAEVAKADDFIVSDKLVSLLLSQLSENRQLNPVFRQLFSAEGAEVYIRPISDYVQTGVPVDFYTLLEAAAQRGETAIGYRLAAQSNNAAASFGVTLNPKKHEKLNFGPADRLVVLAED